MIDLFRTLRHLLPRARAWAVAPASQLNALLRGITNALAEVKTFIDEVWQDILPESTRQIEQWEEQFGIVDRGLAEAERRTRLDAAWKALGGQSPRYIQDTLRNAGFDVYVHEWWEPGSEPVPGVQSCATPRNPLLVIQRVEGETPSGVDCGEPVAQCGEPFAQAGNQISPVGYPLVNKVLFSQPDVFSLAGEAVMQAGEPTALAGNYTTFRETQKIYITPTDPAKWPYFMYVGGQNFGDIATVPATRREEFEDLILKLRPLHVWVGVLAVYT